MDNRIGKLSSLLIEVALITLLFYFVSIFPFVNTDSPRWKISAIILTSLTALIAVVYIIVRLVRGDDKNKIRKLH